MRTTHTPPNTTVTVASRVVISARIAEWRRWSRGRGDLAMLTDHEVSDLPFSKADARAEVAKWFWQR
jgi:uncharacterized protein YjiS (DUF1127 family)